jgi:hypothetical protein
MHAFAANLTWQIDVIEQQKRSNAQLFNIEISTQIFVDEIVIHFYRSFQHLTPVGNHVRIMRYD